MQLTFLHFGRYTDEHGKDRQAQKFENIGGERFRVFR